MADDFYILKNTSVKAVGKIIRWADEIGLQTSVTMLDATKSLPEVNQIKLLKPF